MALERSRNGKPPVVEFDVCADIGGSRTYHLMCDEPITLRSIAVANVTHHAFLYYALIEEALELAGGKVPLPPGTLDELIDCSTRDPIRAAMLKSMLLSLGGTYCQAQGLDISLDDPETAFWRAARTATKHERGCFFPLDIEMGDGSVSEGDIARTLVAELDPELDERFADCVFGYPMLSGLILLIAASLAAHRYEGKHKRNASLNQAADIAGGPSIKNQLIELGCSRDVSQATLKKEFRVWQSVAPLWAAALIVANEFTDDGLPNLAHFGDEFMLMLMDDERRLCLFQTANWFASFASGNGVT